jgi:hypothetical protein
MNISVARHAETRAAISGASSGSAPPRRDRSRELRDDLQMMRAAVALFTAMKGECPRDPATLATGDECTPR